MTYVSKANYNGFMNMENPETGKKFSSEMEARKYHFSPGQKYAKMMGCTRMSTVIIGDNIFVHAGILPTMAQYYGVKDITKLNHLNRIVRKWLLGQIKDDNMMTEILGISGDINKSPFWSRILGVLPGKLKMSDKRCEKILKPMLNMMKYDNTIITRIIVGHTPQWGETGNVGINGTCDNKIIRVDNGSSKAFQMCDNEFINNNKISKYREPQILEIDNNELFIRKMTNDRISREKI